MKLFKKILKIFGIIFLIIITILIIIIYFTGPSLPENTDEIIDKVIKSELPVIVKGKTGYAKSGNIHIWYESISPKTPPKGAVLLFMGISNDALGWPLKFIEPFVDSGYQVIRFDYRGTGMSDWIKITQSNQYSLSDLANDGVAILNSLGIEKAHIIGISLGGMVAQEMAINHPERVASLANLMSSGYIEDPELPKISLWVALNLIKVGIKYGLFKSESNMIKLQLASRTILKGNANYDLDIKGIAEQVLYNIRNRRGYNPDASMQHHAAVRLSGSRYEKLKKLNLSVLIVHGKYDPFIPIEHSKKLTKIIPNSDSLWLDNVGHDIPNTKIDLLTNEIMSHFNL
jgi:pimeloyl-ACP methyl ester carboxylesterase